MEQVYESIIAHFYSYWNVLVYREEIQDEPQIPSMFFPVPETLDMPHTKQQFRNMVTLNIKVFHSTTNQAVSKANELANTVRRQKNRIAINDIDGNDTGLTIQAESISVTPIADKVAQIGLVFYQDENYI